MVVVHANNVVGEGVTHIYGGNDASHVVVGFGGYDEFEFGDFVCERVWFWILNCV